MSENGAEICFEVSFECGNKVGGIHTILKTKAKEMKKKYGENYYTVGFLNKEHYLNEFTEMEIPNDFKGVFDELSKSGIHCKYGTWAIADDVKLILVDSKEFESREINNIKKWFWDDYKIDSVRAKGDYNEPVAWSYAVGIMIEKLVNNIEAFKNKKIVAHFHEWLAGAGLLYLKSKKVRVGLIFTTHATRMGRSKSELGEKLMEEVFDGLEKGISFDHKKAYDYELEALHGMELQTTQNADVFTTVSEIVKDEAKYILHREADIIVPNALDFSKFLTTRTLTTLHERYKNKIIEFLEAYFLPYYPVEIKGNPIIFISGRYEFMNKGIDLFLLALQKLNEKLKGTNAKEVFVFILVPAGIKGPKESVMRSLIEYQRMKKLVEERLEETVGNVINETLSGKKLEFEKVFGKDFLLRLKSHSRFFSNLKGKMPPLVAYELSYPESEDKIIQELLKTGLDNLQDDKVKVIFYSNYLSPDDGLLGMEYQDFIIGSSMGVFPSRYEPWGYTPFETAALRTVSITTDVAGFGRFIMNNFKEKDSAIKVLKILGRSKDEIAEDLAKNIENYVNADIEEKMMQKLICRDQVESLDWSIQVKNYFKAHDLAIKRMKERLSS